MAAVILLITAVGWGVLVVLVAPARYDLGKAGGFTVGLGLTSYLVGVRHAFDADHIAAVDNTTRKLLTDRGSKPRPLSVGFWFVDGRSVSGRGRPPGITVALSQGPGLHLGRRQPARARRAASVARLTTARSAS